MITRGLKKGDKFEDGGRTFVVEKVLPSGDYISRQVEETKEVKEETEEVKEEKPAEKPAQKTTKKKTKEA